MHEDARAETGETFHLRFGSGKVGMMGTGNFNITLVQEQNPDMDFGVALLPGVETGQVASFAGGDIVRGSATVILAMGDGKRVAGMIDAYVRAAPVRVRAGESAAQGTVASPR